MGRPKIDPRSLRKKRYVLLSDRELEQLGLETAFSPWAREKLLAAASKGPAPELPPEPEPKELLLLPPWGQPDAQGALYSWEPMNPRNTAGTLTITSPTIRIEVDLVDTDFLLLPHQIELRFRSRTEFRITRRSEA